MMADREHQIDTLKQQIMEAKLRNDQLSSIEKDKAELEQRIIEIGGNLEKARHKEVKMRGILEGFKQQLESAA